MIKNIIYDLGNVLIKFSPTKFTEKYILEEDRERVFKTIFLSQEWQDLDRGVLEYEEAIDIFSEKEPKYRKEIEYLFNSNVEECLEPIKENIEILNRHSQEGYKLYILSNFHKKAFENVYKKWNFFEKFHGKVVSYECKLLKPEEEIYLHILKKYDLNPQETLFIDDHEPNIIAANKLGIHVVHLDCYTKLDEKLKTVL